MKKVIKKTKFLFITFLIIAGLSSYTAVPFCNHMKTAPYAFAHTPKASFLMKNTTGTGINLFDPVISFHYYEPYEPYMEIWWEGIYAAYQYQVDVTVNTENGSTTYYWYPTIASGSVSAYPFHIESGSTVEVTVHGDFTSVTREFEVNY